MAKTWKVKPRVHQDLIQHLLATRGIVGETNVAAFLHAEYEGLHSPFIFRDMEKAVERIWKAIEGKEIILIYSDYDADAITANAVLYRTFQSLGIKVLTYIPDRFSEGYGLNIEAFKKIKEMGAGLVITVDCGTNSVEEAKFCKENGIDLIITDHHEITGEVPDAYALINPKNPEEKYPYNQLVGVGVAFKLATAIYSKREKHNLPDGFEKWLLDLVAIGTVADCHSLIGENRILVKYGLKVIEKTKWVGLRAIMDLAGFGAKANFSNKKVDTYALGFVIAPRINAAGRIEHASIAFDCLTTDDPEEAKTLAAELEKVNSRRQLLTENVMSEAREQLAKNPDHKILLAAGKDWPKGIVGLVAGKLAEEFGKPVFVMAQEEEFATGSARSIPGLNVVDALIHCQDMMVKFGGHAAAAGYTLRCIDIERFHKALLDYADKNIDDENLERFIEIDAEATPEDISLQTLELLESFEPFGVDNFRPKFLLSNIQIKDMNPVGKDSKHLQMTLQNQNRYFKSIAFNFGRAVEQYKPGENVDLIFEFLADTWNGNKNVKLRLIDFRKANS